MTAPLRGRRALLVVNMIDLADRGISHLSSAMEITTPMTRTPTKEYPKLQDISNGDNYTYDEDTHKRIS
jgi:hypothetical protein